ncbi:hypothetical protein EW146_g7080 [Bondarzewia mesenterica]|uniref:Programmed cell death protein 2 C-terminal domain-containing protein n=1 Tax=Bondarzewia mesenterica TaxID=1095465 RepID=A0A4S4LLT9_9AGAM|nr:hypothetical protein EW146_g7080 [Bondarzewia mesenterica]
MAPRADDDWSDSDSEVGSVVETSVLLGVPDGAVETPSDVKDAAVSRIGGAPVRSSHRSSMCTLHIEYIRAQALLPSPEPPFESSCCKHCENPMELLVQMWCPFEDSPYDRALYVWGCAKSGCQRAEGSVRAWRGLRYNAKYAEKLQRQLAAKKEKEIAKAAAAAAAKSTQTKTNPFSMNSSNAPTHDAESTSSASSLIVALASTALSDSQWLAAPSYPAQYLSTLTEYIPPPKKAKAPTQPVDVEGGGGREGDAWMSEKYENSMDIDQVFERFNERVLVEPTQCVRYDLGGAPLPFSTDTVFNKLFPLPADESAATIVTKADFKVQPAVHRTYVTASVPSCPHCCAKRVFECQLMPNLINVLRDADGSVEEKKMDDAERRKEVERLLKGGASRIGRGMEWGTIMVFSCEKDCCEKEKDGWKEEVVLVQWDD